MKSIKLILIFCSIFVFNLLYAQSPTNCNNALSLCPKKNASYQTKTTDCINSSSRVYFEFEAGIASTTGTFLTYNVSGGTSSYKVYGPFSDVDNSCDLINSYQAPILSQGANSVLSNVLPSFTLVSGKKYFIEIITNVCGTTISLNDASPSIRSIVKCVDGINACEDCIPKFLPSNGQYVLSAWVKEEAAPATVTTYTKPQIIVTGGTTTFPPFVATGQIIDGWQRVEGIFTTANIQTIAIELKAVGGICYFDDIRIFPFDGSMMSYVYDPVSLRLLAELDERNYAKFYEYDEEGKLIRVKKETEKGIMTIQENRENNAIR